VAAEGGRAKLATKPCSTAWSTAPATMGILLVAYRAARTPDGVIVTRTSTFIRTSSLASPGSRSVRPLADRTSSNRIFDPRSSCPTSRSPLAQSVLLRLDPGVLATVGRGERSEASSEAECARNQHTLIIEEPPNDAPGEQLTDL
jgi:hypothetical protein